MTFIGIHGPGAFEIDRSLLAANEYALAILIILSKYLTDMPDELVGGINEVNAEKEAMIKEYFLEQ